MKLEDLKVCPFCGSDEAYYRNYMQGPSIFRFSLAGDKEVDNSTMFDTVTVTHTSERVYCGSCNKYLGNMFTGVLGKEAAKATKKHQEATNE